MRLITFWVGEQIYGIPLLLVGEFYRALETTHVDAGDHRIRGITHLRGGSAVVLNLRAITGADDCESSNGDMIYIHAEEFLCEEAKSQNLRSFEEPVVLMVDRLDAIHDVHPGEIHPTPAHLNDDYYLGVTESKHGDLIILNFNQLIHCILSDVQELSK